MSKVLKVLNLMYDEQISYQDASPNYVAEYAHNKGIELTSYEVVLISDSYGENICITGRSKELSKQLLDEIKAISPSIFKSNKSKLLKASNSELSELIIDLAGHVEADE